MYKFKNFSDSGNKSINSAVDIAGKLGHITIGTEHLLLGILSQGKTDVSDLLDEYGMNFNRLYNIVINSLGSGVNCFLTGEDLSVNAVEALRSANRISTRSGKLQAGVNEIFLSVLDNKECMGYKMLSSYIDNIYFLEEKVKKICYTAKTPTISKEPKKEYKTIAKYSKNLTQTALLNPFDPCIGREKEILRIVEVISRRRKNNPCLVGPAGVGKTAIIEGLANLIATKKAPKEMWDKEIYSLDLAAVLSGTKYRGDFEERMKTIIDEASGDKDVILFIDEIHIIASAGGAEGAIDAANILKPALARSKVQIIGATTSDEYTKIIEKDSALERRFSKVLVDEPSSEVVVKILEGLKSNYENFHKLMISKESIELIVKLSQRYIQERYMPDKAVDLLDEACAKARVMGSGILNEDSIKEAISTQTGIPVYKIQTREKQNLSSLENKLNTKIFGQQQAVKSMVNALKKWRVGLSNENKPIASFLFLGPTGVGKTECSKVLADVMFSSSKFLIRVDCTEYSQKNDVKKLIGAPPGYIGYDEIGKLEKELSLRPYSVVLFDEIEKAHPDLYNLLLQVMDDGQLTTSRGKTLNFKNTIIIMTSNLGAKELVSKNIDIGFSNKDKDALVITREKLESAIKNHFPPEFIGRIDDIIKFEPLNINVMSNITYLMLKDLSKVLLAQEINLEFTGEVARYIANICFKTSYGARNIRNEISKRVESIISDEIINDRIIKGDTVRLTIQNDKIKLEKMQKV